MCSWETEMKRSTHSRESSRLLNPGEDSRDCQSVESVMSESAKNHDAGVRGRCLGGARGELRETGDLSVMSW